MAMSLLYATGSRSVRYVSVVMDWKTHYYKAGEYYRVKVMLRDGSMKWLNTDETLYNEVKDGGGAVVVYEKNCLLGVQFVRVQLPQ